MDVLPISASGKIYRVLYEHFKLESMRKVYLGTLNQLSNEIKFSKSTEHLFYPLAQLFSRRPARRSKYRFFAHSVMP